MRFSDFVAAIVFLEAEDRDGALRECLSELAQLDLIPPHEVDSVFYSLLMREARGSTGIGRGGANPHTVHPGVHRVCGVVAISRTGMDWNSVDGEATDVVFVVVSPRDRLGDHLRALEHISRLNRDDTFMRFLRQCKTADDVWQVLEEVDASGDL